MGECPLEFFRPNLILQVIRLRPTPNSFTHSFVPTIIYIHPFMSCHGGMNPQIIYQNIFKHIYIYMYTYIYIYIYIYYTYSMEPSCNQPSRNPGSILHPGRLKVSSVDSEVRLSNFSISSKHFLQHGEYNSEIRKYRSYYAYKRIWSTLTRVFFF